jgi:hypothetical protein
MLMPRRSMVASVGLLGFAALLAGTGSAPAQSGSPALAGRVSAEQGALERFGQQSSCRRSAALSERSGIRSSNFSDCCIWLTAFI